MAGALVLATAALSGCSAAEVSAPGIAPASAAESASTTSSVAGIADAGPSAAAAQGLSDVADIRALNANRPVRAFDPESAGIPAGADPSIGGTPEATSSESSRTASSPVAATPTVTATTHATTPAAALAAIAAKPIASSTPKPATTPAPKPKPPASTPPRSTPTTKAPPAPTTKAPPPTSKPAPPAPKPPTTTAPSPAPAPNPTPASGPQRQASFDGRMASLVNSARAGAGLAPLTVSGGLTNLAAYWSTAMATGKTGYSLAHNPSLNSMIGRYYPGATTWGENVALFSAGIGADQIFQSYMGSPGHRANILNAKYTHVGIVTMCLPAGSGAHAGTCYNTINFAG